MMLKKQHNLFGEASGIKSFLFFSTLEKKEHQLILEAKDDH